MSEESVFNLQFNNASPEQIYDFLKELPKTSNLDIKVQDLDKLENRIRETSKTKEEIKGTFDQFIAHRKQILDYFGMRSFDYRIGFSDECWGVTKDGRYVFWGGELDDPPDPEEGPYKQPISCTYRSMDYTLIIVESSCGGDSEGIIFDNGLEV